MLFSDMSQMKQSRAWKWTTCLPYSMQERGNTIVPLVAGLVFGRERGLARHFSIVLGNLLRAKKGTFCTYRRGNKNPMGSETTLPRTARFFHHQHRSTTRQPRPHTWCGRCGLYSRGTPPSPDRPQAGSTATVTFPANSAEDVLRI